MMCLATPQRVHLTCRSSESCAASLARRCCAAALGLPVGLGWTVAPVAVAALRAAKRMRPSKIGLRMACGANVLPACTRCGAWPGRRAQELRVWVVAARPHLVVATDKSPPSSSLPGTPSALVSCPPSSRAARGMACATCAPGASARSSRDFTRVGQGLGSLTSTMRGRTPSNATMHAARRMRGSPGGSCADHHSWPTTSSMAASCAPRPSLRAAPPRMPPTGRVEGELAAARHEAHARAEQSLAAYRARPAAAAEPRLWADWVPVLRWCCRTGLRLLVLAARAEAGCVLAAGLALEALSTMGARSMAASSLARLAWRDDISRRACAAMAKRVVGVAGVATTAGHHANSAALAWRTLCCGRTGAQLVALAEAPKPQRTPCLCDWSPARLPSACVVLIMPLVSNVGGSITGAVVATALALGVRLVLRRPSGRRGAGAEPDDGAASALCPRFLGSITPAALRLLVRLWCRRCAARHAQLALHAPARLSTCAARWRRGRWSTWSFRCWTRTNRHCSRLRCTRLRSRCGPLSWWRRCLGRPAPGGRKARRQANLTKGRTRRAPRQSHRGRVGARPRMARRAGTRPDQGSSCAWSAAARRLRTKQPAPWRRADSTGEPAPHRRVPCCCCAPRGARRRPATHWIHALTALAALPLLHRAEWSSP